MKLAAQKPSARDSSRSAFAVIALLLFALLFFRNHASAQTNIVEIPIVANPTQSTAPFGITQSPDGAFWFCEIIGNAIGRIDPVTTNMTAIGLTNNGSHGPFGSNAGPAFIVLGPDTNLWFTEENSNKIVRLNYVTSNYVEFPVGTNSVLATNTSPFGLTTNADGNIWFVEFAQNKIAAFNPFAPTNASGKLNFVHEYGPFGTNAFPPGLSAGTNAQIYSLTSGPDGNLWFTLSTYATIVRMDTSGNYSTFQLPATNCQPLFIVPGPDGAMWFSEFNTNRIGRITTDLSTFTEFTLPPNTLTFTNFPYALAAGRDGIYFSEFLGSVVGRIATNGAITIFPTPTFDSIPTLLAVGNPAFGPDTNLWFGEFPSDFNNAIDDNIGKLVLGEALGVTAQSIIPISGRNFDGVLAQFENSNTNNTIIVGWGDGTTNSLFITNNFATTNSTVLSNKVPFTSTLTITNITPISSNGLNGLFSIIGNHTFISPLSNNFNLSLTVFDTSNDVSIATIVIQDGQGPVRVPLTMKTSGSKLVLSWAGAGFNLQSAPDSSGPWTTVTGAVSPFITTRSASRQFFRLQSQ